MMHCVMDTGGSHEAVGTHVGASMTGGVAHLAAVGALVQVTKRARCNLLLELDLRGVQLPVIRCWWLSALQGGKTHRM